VPQSPFERKFAVSVILERTYVHGGGVRRAPVWVYEAASETTLVAGSPADLPQVWARYVETAHAIYEARGVGAALEYAAIRSGESTSMFVAVLDAGGAVVGGLRVQGQYFSVGESHAVTEWAGQPGRAALLDAMEQRLDGGLVEVKSAFVDPRAPFADLIAARLARVALLVMEMTGVRHLMATAADYVLSRWESGGGRVDDAVAPTPYPDDRYRTRVMFWDRHTVHALAEPDVWDAMIGDYATAFGASVPMSAVAA
jgi:hypothetical protein